MCKHHVRQKQRLIQPVSTKAGVAWTSTLGLRLALVESQAATRLSDCLWGMKAKPTFTKPPAKQWGYKKISGHFIPLKRRLKSKIAVLARLEAAMSNANIENVTANLYWK